MKDPSPSLRPPVTIDGPVGDKRPGNGVSASEGEQQREDQTPDTVTKAPRAPHISRISDFSPSIRVAGHRVSRHARQASRPAWSRAVRVV